MGYSSLKRAWCVAFLSRSRLPLVPELSSSSQLLLSLQQGSSALPRVESTDIDAVEELRQYDKDRLIQQVENATSRTTIDLYDSYKHHNSALETSTTTATPVIISWSDLQDMSKSTGMRRTRRAREALCDSLGNTGTFLLKCNASQAETLQAMWDTMQDYFASPTLDKDQLYHQSLVRESWQSCVADDPKNNKYDEEGDDQNVGYHFIPTYLSPEGQVIPTTVQDTLGHTPATQKGVVGAFRTLEEMTSTAAVVLLAGILGQDVVATREALAGPDDKKWSASNHRMAQYIRHENVQESLRPHTDWSLITVIPYRYDTPGLELWDPQRQEWTKIEEQLDESHANDTIMVVMIGKWLELFSKGRLSSCIHRVVTDPSSKQARLSAPFFLRPSEEVVTWAHENYGSAPDGVFSMPSTFPPSTSKATTPTTTKAIVVGRKRTKKSTVVVTNQSRPRQNSDDILWHSPCQSEKKVHLWRRHSQDTKKTREGTRRVVKRFWTPTVQKRKAVES